MKKMSIDKYRPYPRVDLPDREWPNRVIESAPAWCSVDLRDGNQALIDPMTVDEKMKMFRLLVDIGFKEIEVGFPSASQTDFDFLRRLIDEDLIPSGVKVQVLTQSREHLIRRSFNAMEGLKNAVVHLYNSTSELQRRVVFKKDKKEIIQIATQGTELIKSLCNTVPQTDVVFEYSPESFTGTELEFAVEVCEAVMGVWGPTPEKKAILNLPATVEMSTPNIYADTIEWFCRKYKDRDSVIISLHCHNDRGTSVAASELALMAGADRVEGTLFGNGERTGNVDIVTLALNLFSQGVDPRLDFTDIDKVIDMSKECTKIPLHKRHPYAGELVYTAFSGSHQDAINKGMHAHNEHKGRYWEVPYLPIDPQDVGRTYEKIIRVNSQSGKGGVAYIMEEKYGFELPKAMRLEFGEIIQTHTEQTGKEVSPEEIYNSFKKTYMEQSGPYELENIHIDAEDSDTSETSVRAKLKVNGESREVRGKGNVPIDAFVHALINQYGDFQFKNYSEHALSVGSSSKAAAYVELATKDIPSCFGVGVDSSITKAPMKAVISALNRINERMKRQEIGVP